MSDIQKLEVDEVFELTNREKEATSIWLVALEDMLDDICADEPYTRAAREMK